MTVIAYRDGVMAADSGGFGPRSCHNFTRKLIRSADGTLYGILGDATEGQAYFAWVQGGCIGAAPVPRWVDETVGSSYDVLRVRPGRDPELITTWGVQPYSDAPYIAVGAAAPVALGALYVGATAAAAIAAAIGHSVDARGPVRTISHEG